MAMTKTERKARFDVAVEIVEKVYNDMCHASTDEVSREETLDFCYFLQEMYKMSTVLGENKEKKDD